MEVVGHFEPRQRLRQEAPKISWLFLSGRLGEVVSMASRRWPFLVLRPPVYILRGNPVGRRRRLELGAALISLRLKAVKASLEADE